MSIVRNFNLYLNAGNGSAPYINVNQYDQGEQWVFTLYKEDGTKYLPSTGAIVGIKADNRGIINTGTVDTDGRVVINETQQMTAAAGIAIFELLIDGDSHGTANFLVNVEQRPGDNADLSDSDLSLIQQAVDSAAVIVEVIGDSDPSAVIGEHVDDWLDNHPEATTTVQDGAITAPKLNNSLWDKLLVSEEASGAVASFDDGADDVPVSSLKVNLEPIQTGTGDPSPTNIRPISGHSSVTVEQTGKNLLNQSDFVVGSINGTTGADFASNNRLRSPFVTVESGKTYTVQCNSELLIFELHRYDESKNWLSFTTVNRVSSTFTVDSDTRYMKFLVRKSDNSVVTVSELTAFQLEEGNATPYEPYVGNTYTSDLGQFVYGGTVDLATGVLTVTYGIYTVSAVDSLVTKTGFIRVRSTNPTEAYASSTNEKNAITNNMVFNYIGIIGFNGNPSVPFSFYVSGSYTYFVLPTSAATDVATANTWFTNNPTTVVYPLATPTTVQLTPQEVKTLLGYNNISSSGTVDVIYHADTKLYVDKMTNVDNAIIAPTEETFTATRNYTVNDLVIVNDTLYKVTANIANGGTITPNSNVQQTTLSALIKALS